MRRERTRTQPTRRRTVGRSEETKKNFYTKCPKNRHLAGVIIYSVAKNTWGFLTLIPLYFIYKMVKGDKKNAALKQVLKERRLK